MGLVGCGYIAECPPVNGTPGPPGPIGKPGKPGPEGPPGIDGINAFGITTAPFTVPAVGAQVVVEVNPAQWATPKQIVYVLYAGYFQVSQVSTVASMTLINLGSAGNALPGIRIAAGVQVAPAGAIGPPGIGEIGPPGSAYAFATAPFTIPPVGQYVVVGLTDTTWATIGEWVWVEGANGGEQAGIMQIASICGTSLTLYNDPMSFIGEDGGGIVPATPCGNFCWWQGNGSPVTNPPAGIKANDLYLDLINGQIWFYNGKTFCPLGAIS